MQVHKNEITITQGESFTLNKLVQNKDGSPYIISSEINNPYFIISISSSLRNTDNRYEYHKLLSLKDFPRFKYLKPVDITKYGYDFSANTLPNVEGDRELGYVNDAIFYAIDRNGVINYKYWEYINNEESEYDGHWRDYVCPIVTTFSTKITKNWSPGTYYYQIMLVDYDESVSDFSKAEILQVILQPTKILVKNNLNGGSVL